MKKIILFCLFFYCTFTTEGQVITLEHGGVTSFPASFQDAVNTAQTGDTITLPAGSFGGVSIGKKIVVIGVGYDPKGNLASGRTTISAGVSILSGADGLTLQGLDFRSSFGINGAVSNVSISRCIFHYGIAISEPTSRLNLIENIFKEAGNSSGYSIFTYYRGSYTQSFISNNIFVFVANFNNQNRVFNNVFLNTVYFANNCEVRNNVISGGGSGNSCQFYNNLFNSSTFADQIAQLGSSNTVQSSKVEVFANTFVNPRTLSGGVYPFDLLNNYSLKLGSLGINAGDDGTDCGIYGGVSPFKADAIPSNPHIISKNIPRTTNQTGQLPVTIQVAAQRN